MLRKTKQIEDGESMEGVLENDIEVVEELNDEEANQKEIQARSEEEVVPEEVEEPKEEKVGIIINPQDNQEEKPKEVVITMDLSEVKPTKSKPGNTGKVISTEFRVLNTPTSGKKIVVKDSLIEYIGTNEVEIALGEEYIVLAPKGAGISEHSYCLRKAKSIYNLYKSDLVIEITDHLELDFTGITTISLQVLRGKTDDGTNVVKLSK